MFSSLGKRSMWLLVPMALGMAGPAWSGQSTGHGRGVHRAVAGSSDIEAALRTGRYDRAERLLEQAKAARQAGTVLLRGRLALVCGRYDQARRLVQPLVNRKDALGNEAAVLVARALLARGKVDEAITTLQSHAGDPEARRVRLLLGEAYLLLGKRDDARGPLMSLIRDYNDDIITDNDGEGLALVGRAAALLRSRADANDAYDQAERAGNHSDELLRWRAELFLDAHDPGHAEEVLLEARKVNPHHPDTLTLLAKVKLKQSLDFDAALELLDRALQVNPHHTGALFVRAGIALRDNDHRACSQAITQGLSVNPHDLSLLSLHAAERFLADDEQGFDRARQQVLSVNPHFGRFYTIISDFADWHHRYPEIVAMMKKAVKVDPDNEQAWAVLGLNSLRLGDDKQGVDALRKAWSLDHYDVRVYNLLELYEHVIPQQYVTERIGPFRFRFEKKHAELLRRYVAPFLQTAYRSMVRRYHYTPPEPVGIELYTERQWFGVRTSGLPATAIQGVCFGRTLAAMSPSSEPFDWGNILWHELGHVFAIEISHSRVPRWFTEGLSEYETFMRNPTWQREQDPALYRAIRDGRLPHLRDFDKAFTHAESMSDVAVAYYAASQIVTYMAERWGMEAVVRMLQAWGKGQTTEQVMQNVLGLSLDGLERAFRRKWLAPRLSRYRSQFVPLTIPSNLDKARKAVQAHPKRPAERVRLVMALLANGKKREAIAELGKLRKTAASDPNVRFLVARVAASQDHVKEAKKQLEAMIREGHDGYEVRMALAEIASEQKKPLEARSHLLAARRLDPTQTDSLAGLADLARKHHWKDLRLQALQELSVLEQHDPRPVKRLLALLVERERWKDAVVAGQRAVMRDPLSFDVHRLYGEALSHGGDTAGARREWQSALLCDAKEQEKKKLREALSGLK